MARDDRRRLRRILGALDRSGVGARAVPMIDGDAMAPLLELARPDRDRRGRKGGTMDDAEVLGRINELAREEHELFERESHGTVTDADRDRLRRLQVTLDQCWDLLRHPDGLAGRRGSTPAKHGFEMRRLSRATRADSVRGVRQLILRGGWSSARPPSEQVRSSASWIHRHLFPRASRLGAK